MFIIYRPIEGISLNGNEYLKNDKGKTMRFTLYEDAFNFLLPNYRDEHHLQHNLDEGIINIGEESEVL